MSPATRRVRGYHLRRFAATVDAPPDEVDLDTIVRYLSSRRWDANMRASVRASLRGFYRWAVLAGVVDKSPADDVPKVRVPRGKPRPATDAALEVAMAGADERVRLMLRLGAHVGLRCLEIAQVHANDLERVTVTGKKGKRSIRWRLRVVGKGGKTRVVPVPDDLAVEIQQHTGYLFPGQIDGHISPGYVSRLVGRALPPGYSAHTLRHRYATKALRGSKNLRAVQELLGHASVATTQIYTEVDDDDLWKAATAAA